MGASAGGELGTFAIWKLYPLLGQMVVVQPRTQSRTPAFAELVIPVVGEANWFSV
jgi:hypothetical protein